MDIPEAYVQLTKLEAERNKALASLNAVYRERAELVALLTRGWPSEWADDADNPGWRVVYVYSPAGQLTWHIAPADWPLFVHVRHNADAVWDGHSTAEKYERLRRISLLDDWVAWGE